MQQYRPDIDGLRAISVSAVLLFHAFPSVLPGGYIGVDIFFVISGFLITSILLADADDGTYSIARFYGRRIQRIFPTLIVVLAATMAAGYVFLFSSEFRTLSRHALASAFFVENLLLWSESGYFDTSSLSKPLLHLWSLAVEEQYYLIWPLVILALRSHRKAVVPVAAALGVASLAYSIYLTHADPTAAYYSPLSRIWEIMAGSLLAATVARRQPLSPKAADASSWVGITLIVIGLVAISDDTRFPGIAALLPVLGGCAIVAAGSGAIVNRTVLSHRWMVAIGLISYPLYLWHWPVLSYVSIAGLSDEPLARPIAVASSFALATITYRYIEIPVRRHSPSLATFALVSATATIAVVTISIQIIGVTPPLGNGGLTGQTSWSFLRQVNPGALSNQTAIYRIAPERAPRTVLMGDSHVAQYAERIFSITKADPKARGADLYVGAGCNFIPGVLTDDRKRIPCGPLRDEAWQIARRDATSPIVIGGAWYSYFTQKSHYVVVDGERHLLASPTGRRVAMKNLKDAIKRVVGAGSRPVYLLMGNPSSKDFDPRAAVDRLRLTPTPTTGRVSQKQIEIAEELHELAQQAGARVIDPRQLLCIGVVCRTRENDDTPIFMDNAHFNPVWARMHAAFIDQVVQSTQ